MEAALEAYQKRFADFRTGLVAEVDSGIVLIEVGPIQIQTDLDCTQFSNLPMQWQELLKELESTKTALRRTKLDLDSECEARRRLQEEVQGRREWEERHGRRPFVIALIDADADGYVVSGPCVESGSLSMPWLTWW